MEDRMRRTEVGKMFIDVAKYVLTIVVIGGLFSERLSLGTTVLGIVLATGATGVGFHIIPKDEEGKENVR